MSEGFATIPADRDRIIQALAWAVLAYAAAWCSWILFQGYGYDNGDSYRMLNTWQVILAEHRYEGSRYQGSIIPEILLGFTAALGGPVASNLVSFAFSIASLFALAGIGRFFGVRSFLPVAAGLLANGAVIIAASTTTDYMIALGIFSWGFYLLLREEDAAGIVLLGASAGARISYALVAVLTVLFVLLYRRHVQGRTEPWYRFVLCMTASFIVSGLFYMPVWVQHGMQFDWLTSVRPTGQGVTGLLARAIYKSAMFVGVLGWLGLVAGLFLDRRRLPGRLPRLSRPRKWFVLFCIGIGLFHLLLYCYIPNKAEYLLPALTFGIFALQAMELSCMVLGLAMGEIFSGILMVAPLRISYESHVPCTGVLAEGATFAPHLEAGVLIANERERDVNTACGMELLMFKPSDPFGPLPTRPQ